MLTLFNSKGHFVYPTDEQIAALTPSERERFESVRIAFEENASTEKDVADATSRVQQDVIDISEIEQHLKTFKQPTFLDLHRAMCGKNSGSRHPGAQ